LLYLTTKLIKRYNPKQRFFRQRNKGYQINHFITASTLRIIDETGKQIGLLSKSEALKKANDLNLDLVEIAPKAQPPVAKIIDFNKFLYLLEKKKRQAKSKTKSGETKEIWLTPFIGEHDLNLRIEKGKKLLLGSGKLKVVVRFRGRQITKRDFGFQVINKFISSQSEAKVEKNPYFEGRNLVAILSKK